MFDRLQRRHNSHSVLLFVDETAENVCILPYFILFFLSSVCCHLMRTVIFYLCNSICMLVQSVSVFSLAVFLWSLLPEIKWMMKIMHNLKHH